MSILSRGLNTISGKAKEVFYDIVGDHTQRIKSVYLQNMVRNVAIDEGLSYKIVNDSLSSGHPNSGMDYANETLIFEGNGKYSYVLPLSQMSSMFKYDIKTNITMCVEHANANDIKNFQLK